MCAWVCVCVLEQGYSVRDSHKKSRGKLYRNKLKLFSYNNNFWLCVIGKIYKAGLRYMININETLYMFNSTDKNVLNVYTVNP